MKIFWLALSMCVMALDASPSQAGDIVGSASSTFISSATGKSRVALPSVLLFDPDGCLRWVRTDFKSKEWRASLSDELARSKQIDCEAAWPEVARQLTSEGVSIEPEKMAGQHILIWYGSSDLCQPCRDIKASVWEEIKRSMPPETTSIALDWK